MQVTLFSDYALRMLMYLGVRPDEVVPISQIAEAFGASRHYMLKVMNDLTEAGYITAVRGRRGGVKLAKAPADIRVGKLVKATEPHEGLLDCIPGGSDCPIEAVCKLRKIFIEAQAEFYRTLDNYTVADLIAQPKKLQRILLKQA